MKFISIKETTFLHFKQLKLELIKKHNRTYDSDQTILYLFDLLDKKQNKNLF